MFYRCDETTGERIYRWKSVADFHGHAQEFSQHRYKCYDLRSCVDPKFFRARTKRLECGVLAPGILESRIQEIVKDAIQRDQIDLEPKPLYNDDGSRYFTR
jgi:hypothetical protein